MDFQDLGPPIDPLSSNSLERNSQFFPIKTILIIATCISLIIFIIGLIITITFLYNEKPHQQFPSQELSIPFKSSTTTTAYFFSTSELESSSKRY